MGFNYASLEATALRLITDFGRDVSIVYKTDGTYDAATDTLSGNSETPVTVKAVVTLYIQKEIDGTLIKNGDKQMLIAASGVKMPRSSDIVVDDCEYNIINVIEIKTGDTSMIYKIQVRR